MSSGIVLSVSYRVSHFDDLQSTVEKRSSVAAREQDLGAKAGELLPVELEVSRSGDGNIFHGILVILTVLS